MLTVHAVTSTQAGKSRCQICEQPYHTGELRAGQMTMTRGGKPIHAHVSCINTEAYRVMNAAKHTTHTTHTTRAGVML